MKSEATTLILAAHGSPHGQVNSHLTRFAARLAERSVFADVQVAIHYGTPNFETVLDRVTTPDVAVLPMMTSTGYFSTKVLPESLARHRDFVQKQVRFLSPIGQAAGLVEMMGAQAEQAALRQGLRPSETSMVVVGHGTGRNQLSRDSTFAIQDGLLERNDSKDSGEGRFGQVLAAFIDDRPRLTRVARRLKGGPTLVLPFLITDGPHFRAEIPEAFGVPALSEEVFSGGGDSDGGATVWIERPLLFYPDFADRVLHHACHELMQGSEEEALCGGAATLRIGTRGSALAIAQTEIVQERLRHLGINSERITVTTGGDQRLDVPISSLPANTFSDALEEALRAGEIDIAVHSYKDMDLLETRPGVIGTEFCFPAVLYRGDPREVLVTHDGRSLAALPSGTTVGVSCRRRAAQLQRLRPDLVVRNIRGAVDARIEQVKTGRYDAIVLAAAGLQRLGRKNDIHEIFSPQDFLPAAAQAALVLQCRLDDIRTRQRVRALESYSTRVATDLEWEVERLVRQRAGWDCGVLVRYTGKVRMWLRLIDPLGAVVGSIHLESPDCRAARRKALRWLRRRLSRATGRVTLVGAGPGDAGLISRRGLTCLRKADVVVHDRLISPLLLTEIRDDAQVFDVGKFPERHKRPQEAISRLLIQHAFRGRNVVRLKGGDPFVFGRGQEEVDACREVGIPVRVVPGITSALAGPAAAGIPVTERGVAAAVTITTGQRGSSFPDAGLDASLFGTAFSSGQETTVVLMGRRNLKAITLSMIEAGRSPATSAACIENASLPTQRSITGTLATIAELADSHELSSPMVLVVGEVVQAASRWGGSDASRCSETSELDERRDAMPPRRTRPPLSRFSLSLQGRRIAITRQRSRSRELVRGLYRAGAEVLVTPAFSIAPCHLGPSERELLRTLDRFDAVALTSPNAVEQFLRHLREVGSDLRRLPKLFSVGPATTDALRRHQLGSDCEPESEYSAEGLADAICRHSTNPGYLLHPCSSIAETTLTDRLGAAGWMTTRLAIYENRQLEMDPSHLDIECRGLDAVVFCSASAVRNWVQQGLPTQPLAVCIGSVTAGVAELSGFRVRTARQSVVGEIIATLEESFADGTMAPHPSPSLISQDR